jgi:hypothetical protein
MTSPLARSPSAHPPRPFAMLAVAVACVASAMLLFELIVTRIFSVLFFYHLSVFAISLVMAGLVLGGIWAARWSVPGEAPARVLGAPRPSRLGVFSGDAPVDGCHQLLARPAGKPWALAAACDRLRSRVLAGARSGRGVPGGGVCPGRVLDRRVVRV